MVKEVKVIIGRTGEDLLSKDLAFKVRSQSASIITAAEGDCRRRKRWFLRNLAAASCTMIQEIILTAGIL